MCQSRENCFENVHSRLPKTKRTALHLAARHGKVQCIGILVKYGADMEAEDKDKRTAMALAAWMGHCNVLRILSTLGASTKVVGRKYLKYVDKCLEGKRIYCTCQ